MAELFPRRDLLRSAAVMGGAAFLAVQSADADDKPKAAKCSPIVFDKAVAVAPVAIGAKTIAVNVSEDKLATTILFDSLQATYGPEKNATAFTPFKTAFLEIPVTPGSDHECHLFGYTFDLRGTVDLSAGARAAVILVVGGESRQIEFPFDKARNDDFQKRFVFLPHHTGKPGNAVIRNPLRVQIHLFVETASPSDGAVLTVAALDIEARRA